jgi:hypothetical protein
MKKFTVKNIPDLILIVASLWIIWLGASGYVGIGANVFTTTEVSFRAINFTAAGTEALVTLTPQRDFVDGGTGTSFAPTAKSILKLQSLCVMTQNAGAAVQGVIVRLRVNPTGTAVVGSPIVAIVGAGTTSATANNTGGTCLQFGDGMELFSTAQLAITQVGSATAGNDVVLTGYERVQQ